MGHGYDDPLAPTGSVALAERGEHLRDRAECAGGEVRDLDGGSCGVFEDARPPEVVHVVACPLTVRALSAESGNRAVDDRVGYIVGADSDAGRDAGPKTLENDICPGAERLRERHVGRDHTRPTRCRLEARCPTRAPSSASDRRPATRPERPARRAAGLAACVCAGRRRVKSTTTMSASCTRAEPTSILVLVD